MTDFIDASGFRANVGIVLVRARARSFSAVAPGGRGWQFPQGGIGRDEDPEEGMFRELKEEVGLDKTDVRVIASTRGWLRYRLPAQYLRRNARQTCIGQKQRWFMLELTSEEDRFRFDTTATPEFESWRWVDYWSPVREVIYFKRAVYAGRWTNWVDWPFQQGRRRCLNGGRKKRRCGISRAAVRMAAGPSLPRSSPAAIRTSLSGRVCQRYCRGRHTQASTTRTSPEPTRRSRPSSLLP